MFLHLMLNQYFLCAYTQSRVKIEYHLCCEATQDFTYLEAQHIVRLTWANSLSCVLLVDMHMKATAGNITQMSTPIVEPTSPRTNSMLGISSPTVSETHMILMVKHLNRVSGIWLLMVSWWGIWTCKQNGVHEMWGSHGDNSGLWYCILCKLRLKW